MRDEEILQWLKVTLSEFQPQIEFVGTLEPALQAGFKHLCIPSVSHLLISVCLCFPIFSVALVVLALLLIIIEKIK